MTPEELEKRADQRYKRKMILRWIGVIAGLILLGYGFIGRVIDLF